MSQHDDSLYLTHMLESAIKARQFVENKSRSDYDSDEILSLALQHLIQIIGEAAGSVSPAARALIPSLPWTAITGMRHRIVHGYAIVDHDLVWNTIAQDLEPLIVAVKAALDRKQEIRCVR